MSALADLATSLGVDLDAAYKPSPEEMVELASTLLIAERVAILREATKPGAPSRAKFESALRFWEARLEVAYERDRLQAGRRALGPEYDTCWCLGLGGSKPVVLVLRDEQGRLVSGTMPDGGRPTTFERFCGCPDGTRAREGVERLRADLEAQVRKRRIERITGLAKIPPLYKGLTLESWRDAALAKGATRSDTSLILKRLKDWYTNTWEGQPEGGPVRPFVLLLGGPYGGGKTAMAAIMAQRWIDAERSVIFRTAPEWLSELRAAPWRGSDGEPTELALLKAAREADLFVFDDWGSEALTASNEQRVIEALHVVLDHRMTHFLPTILTTNLGREEMTERVGARILERVASDQVSVRVNVNIPSLRSSSW